MDDPRLIWRLGRWVAERKPGRARLTASSGAFEIVLRDGRIVGVTGVDTSQLGKTLDCDPQGKADLVAEAVALSATNDIPEAAVMGAAKVLVQEHLRAWYLDPDRQLELIDDLQEARPANSISATHAIVELVLADPEGATTNEILPSLNVLLRRADNFLGLYAPLGLAEEADLIVAKITGQRTAEEIASRSPHDRNDVVKLLAALTASGILEAVYAAAPEKTPVLVADPEPAAGFDRQPSRLKLPPLLILVAAAVLAVATLATWWFLIRSPASSPTEEIAGHWAVAVDLGCEPHEYRRLLQLARRHDNVRPIALTGGDESGEGTCWRLVWGDFPTKSKAEDSISSVPADILREGFEPHVVEVEQGTDVVEDGQ